MTPIHAVLIVIIRLWAAGFIVSGLLIIAEVPFYLFEESEGFVIFQPRDYLTAGAWLFVGLVAWIAASSLARRVYPKPAETEFKISVSAELLVAIGSFLIGGFYLAKHGPSLLVDLAWWFIQLAGEDPMEDGSLGTVRHYIIEWRSTISNLLVVVVATWMTLRPAWFAKIFNWLRTAGQHGA